MSGCFEAETNVRPSDDYSLARERARGVWKFFEELRVKERGQVPHDCGGDVSDRVKRLAGRVKYILVDESAYVIFTKLWEADL